VAFEDQFLGAVFEDGGELIGWIVYWPQVFGQVQPIPKFFNVAIQTTNGLVMTGSSKYTDFTYCFDAQKRPICAPGADLLFLVELGSYGEPGYRLSSTGYVFRSGGPIDFGHARPAGQLRDGL
jgi:hypothetical protein